jgi:methylated-DNA-[protein]-cysteine S-methyltransferase
MSHASIDTPIGPLTVVTTMHGVSEVHFGAPAVVGGENGPEADRILSEALGQLEQYFAGARIVFDVPLDRSARRGFRGEVLDALERVPYGEVITYGDLACRAGRPGAARAVGTAMATNPIAVIVPCHRVLPAGGGVGGFGGGVPAKESGCSTSNDRSRPSERRGRRQSTGGGPITMQPLWPPKPKLFESTGPGVQGRASPTTRSIGAMSGSGLT